MAVVPNLPCFITEIKIMDSPQLDEWVYDSGKINNMTALPIKAFTYQYLHEGHKASSSSSIFIPVKK